MQITIPDDLVDAFMNFLSSSKHHVECNWIAAERSEADDKVLNFVGELLAGYRRKKEVPDIRQVIKALEKTFEQFREIIKLMEEMK